MKFFKSVRSWGVLGMLLALVLAVGYGQVQVGQPPALTLPATDKPVGDIFAVLDPAKPEEQFYSKISVTVSAVPKAPFEGEVLLFDLAPLDAQPEDKKTIDKVFARAPISRAKPSVKLDIELKDKTVVGILVVVTKSAETLSYTLSVIADGSSITAPLLLLDNISLAMVMVNAAPTYTFHLLPLKTPTPPAPPKDIQLVCYCYFSNHAGWRPKCWIEHCCRRRTDPGFARHHFYCMKTTASDRWTWIEFAKWGNPGDPNDLHVTVKMCAMPRCFIGVQCWVYQYKP